MKIPTRFLSRPPVDVYNIPVNNIRKQPTDSRKINESIMVGINSAVAGVLVVVLNSSYFNSFIYQLLKIDDPTQKDIRIKITLFKFIIAVSIFILIRTIIMD